MIRVYHIVAVAAVALFVVLSGSLFQNVEADELVVIQDPIDGELHWYTTPGIKWQGTGKVTSYPRQAIYEFETSVRFNDGGHGTMLGSIQYEMPLDEKRLTDLHVRYGSREAVQQRLIETVVNKSIYMTGPLMSSKESYAERRNSLIHYVEDQVTYGVYQTRQREEKVKDPITGVEKTATLVEIALDAKGAPQRQEDPVLDQFGIRTFNFALTKLDYDGEVEKQISGQQRLAMSVQTAIAEAKQAEQQALTAEQNGKALAAKAKWEQEVIKAKEVTAAQQRLEVATLNAQSAEQYKREQTLRGEGDAAYKQKVMAADGALAQKLATYEKVQENWANAIAKYNGAWVPQYVMGGNAAASGNGAQTMVDLLTAKTARELSLDVAVKR